MSLVLESVHLAYPDGDRRLVALDDVSLSVRPGEFVAVMGPSGSGKSSLLAVAGLLRRPDSGRVVLGGRDATELSPSARTAMRREHIGFVFQQSNLIASLTAEEQLLAAAHLAGRPPRVLRSRARELLAAVGLRDATGRRPDRLSGGQRQRVGIARALINDPAVLLVDEPTSALDHARGMAIVELLAGATRDHGVATVVVTHDLSVLDRVDRVTHLHDGRLAVDTPRDSRTLSSAASASTSSTAAS